MKFSLIVKHARETIGISQEELAHALKVSFATISRWENEKTHPNKMAKSVFFAFCREHGINAEDMLQEKGKGGK